MTDHQTPTVEDLRTLRDVTRRTRAKEWLEAIRNTLDQITAKDTHGQH